MASINGHAVNEHAGTSNGLAARPVGTRAFNASAPPAVDGLKTICECTLLSADYPLAAEIQKNILIYDIAALGNIDGDEERIAKLKDEWHHNLYQGSGVIVLKNLYSGKYEKTVDTCADVFKKHLHGERQQRDGTEKPLKQGESLKLNMGFSKLALTSPETFVEYFSNPWLARVAEAWVGPAWRVNTQVNVVPPGGLAQASHRDYHMGYFDAVACGKYPRTTQISSQFLTLQGAVAHSDMPPNSGPTRFLPFSQMFEEGYMVHRLQEFQGYFLDHYVSLSLKKGDAVFFNPAIFHGAGANVSTDIYRNAHLIQINSVFGRPLERSNTASLTASVWSPLVRKYKQEGLSAEVKTLVAAMAEGHPFPTNPDLARPKAGLFQLETEQHLVYQALEENWTQDQVFEALKTNRFNREDHIFDNPKWAALGQGRWCPS